MTTSILGPLLLIVAGALIAVAYGLRRTADPAKRRAAAAAGGVAVAALLVSILLLVLPLLA